MPAGRFRQVDWTTAISAFCERMKSIQRQHGPESVAFLSTGQIATEEMALLGSLAKFGMGMVHGDGNTRQCMATSVVAYKQAFGFDAPPYTYADFEAVGRDRARRLEPVHRASDPVAAHLPQSASAADHRHRSAARPKRRWRPRCTCRCGPKSDLTLFYGLAHLLIREGWIDARLHRRAHERLRGLSRACCGRSRRSASPPRPASTTPTLRRVARTIHEGKRVSFWWTMGVNQSYEGVRTAQSLINLALMTGNIGRPGTGANSITGQCNAMGSRLFSNTTNLLGGRDFQNAEHRAEGRRRFWTSTRRAFPTGRVGPTTRSSKAFLRERFNGLWVIATNPAHSWINQHMLRDVLSRLDFLVVQDMYSHDGNGRSRPICVLPAAAWGEKEGTFINSERRIGLIKKVARAPGQALADFSIFRLIAESWGCGEMFRRWTSPEAVFQILKELSRGQPCDITGIATIACSTSAAAFSGRIPENERRLSAAPQRRLFADGHFYHPDGKARFLFDAPTPLPEPPTSRYPLLLLTGRGTASQWHTQTRTSKSAVLRKLYPPEFYVEINPADARHAGIKPNHAVVVESQRGSLVAQGVRHSHGAAGPGLPAHALRSRRTV